MSAKVDMYRPYLSGKEVLLILKAIEQEWLQNPESVELKTLYRKLKQFQFKIAEGIVTPNFSRNHTLEEAVGVVKNPNQKPESELRDRLNDLATRYMNDPLNLTKEEIEEGKRLELLEYKMNMGMFPQESN